MTFGLILLIPVIFIAFALFGDLSAQVNKNPETLFMQVHTYSERSGRPDSVPVPDDNGYIYGQPEFSYSNITAIGTEITSAQKFAYEQIIYSSFDFDRFSTTKTTNSSTEFTVKIGGTEKILYQSNAGGGSGGSGNYSHASNPCMAAIIDTKITPPSGFIPTKISDKFPNTYTAGSGFTGTGKGQVIVSEKFLQMLGITAQQAVNTKFTLNYTDKPTNSWSGILIDSSNIPTTDIATVIDHSKGFESNYRDAALCYEYEIVGVIAEAVTDYARTAFKPDRYSTSVHLMTNMLFFTDASLYMEDGSTLEPVINRLSGEDSNGYDRSVLLATYTQTQIEFISKNKEYMCLGANKFNSFTGNNQYYGGNDSSPPPASTAVLYLDMSSFDQLDRAVTDTVHLMTPLLGSDANNYLNAGNYVPNYWASALYVNVKMMYDIFTYVILIFAIMGGIIFFAATVNLFNSIVHSVDSRKNYLGVMRAVGAKSRVIPKLYMAEIYTIFRRVALWVVIFVSIICIGIKIGIDEGLKYVTEFLPFQISIGYIYIPIAIGIGLGLAVLLGITFAVTVSRKVSKKPITTVLGNQ